MTVDDESLPQNIHGLIRGINEAVVWCEAMVCKAFSFSIKKKNNNKKQKKNSKKKYLK